jgi:hypothetical protein
MTLLLTELEKAFAAEIEIRLIRGEKTIDLKQMSNVPWRGDKLEAEWIAEVIKDTVFVKCYVIKNHPMQHLPSELIVSTDFRERLNFRTNTLFTPIPYTAYYQTYHKDTFK